MTPRLTVTWIALASLATAPAHAHGGVQLGIGVGVPLPYAPAPYYAPFPYYTPPPVVVVPPPASSSVQQAPANVYSTRPPGQPLYYYCAGTKGYYPHVRECPCGWEAVPAAPR